MRDLGASACVVADYECRESERHPALPAGPPLRAPPAAIPQPLAAPAAAKASLLASVLGELLTPTFQFTYCLLASFLFQ